MSEGDWIRELMIVLATAGVVVPLFGRLRFGPVLGFLIAGVILGPGGLGHLSGDRSLAGAVHLLRSRDMCGPSPNSASSSCSS